MKIPRWVVLTAALALAGVAAVIVYGYAARPGWVGVSGKKFWDYLELLIVPAAIAIGVAGLSWMQSARQRLTEEAQQERERKAEEARRERELEVENQRAQDEALQAYLDQIGGLLLHEGLGQSHQEADKVRTLARARTLTVLMGLGPERKGRLIQFLDEATLIQKRTIKASPVISLKDANLSRAKLHGTRLRFAELTRTDLRDADLSNAKLNRAYLRRADLTNATLRDAYLGHATLRGADLSGADLTGAEGITDEQLAECKSLQGATMPNGQKYEEWLEVRVGSEEDGENGSSS